MIRILYVSNTTGLDGASKCLLTLLQHIDRTKIEPFAIVPGEGPLVAEIESLSIKYEFVRIPWWLRIRGSLDLQLNLGITRNADLTNFNLGQIQDLSQSLMERRLYEIRRIIRENSIDIVQTNAVSILEAALAARLTGTKHVWHIHEYIDDHPGLYSCLPSGAVEWFLNNLSDRLVVPTEAVRQAYGTRVPLEKISQIYNGVPMPKRNERSASSRGLLSPYHIEFSIKPKEKLICSVGHDGPEKGWNDLVETAHLLSKERTDFKFILVGRIDLYGHNFRDIMRRIEELKLEDKLIFTGYRDDAQEIMSASDIAFFPSRMETFSLSAAEAMALHVPVVGTVCGGMEEVVVSDQTGILVKPCDHGRMAEALAFLMDDPDERERLGENGRQVFLEKFSPAKYAKQFMEIYVKLMNTRPNEEKKPDALSDRDFEAFASLYSLISSLSMQTEVFRRELQELRSPLTSSYGMLKKLLQRIRNLTMP